MTESIENIDRNQLSECMTGELEIDQDLIECAIQEIENRYSDMRDALKNEDYPTWRASAHRSVGTTATLGFSSLATEFKIAESFTQIQPELVSLLEKISTLIESTRRDLMHIGYLK